MNWRRWLAITTLILAAAVLLTNPHWLAAIRRASNTESVHVVAQYLRGFGLWTPTVSIGLMIIQALISPLRGSLVSRYSASDWSLVAEPPGIWGRGGG